jgi:hypothetical protein
MISDPTPQEPGKEVGISIDVVSTGGITLDYTWNADGGEIVRGQGSPAITYRVPEEPGTYNVRVQVAWDSQSVEKVTSIRVKGETPEATATLSANNSDPTKTPFYELYDNFNDPEYDGDFNHYLWEYWHENLEGVTQENGSLQMQSSLPTSLIARGHAGVVVTSTTLYEVEMKLSDDPIGGSATLKLHVDMHNNDYWTTQCGLLVPDIAFCELGIKGKEESLYTKEKRIDATAWHKFRIEVDPENKRVNYYIDEEPFGKANIPVDENGKYSPVIGIFPVSGNTLAYFDNVDFGAK